MGTHFREQDDFIQILEVTPATRQALEDTIDRLIALLDQLDPDPDMEESGDLESSLGGATGDDRELDTSDDEHSLGWSIPNEHTVQGLGYTAYVTDDEAGCTGCGTDDDEEDFRNAPVELSEPVYEKEAA